MANIVVDVQGQDGPISIAVNASIKMAKENPNLNIILSGDEKEIKKYYNSKLSNIEILDAPEKILHTDGIMQIRRKPNSSLVKAVELIKSKKADAIVSAGASGPFIASTYLILGGITPEIRPAFAAILPTIDPNKRMLFLDTGANSDVTPEQLEKFALIGQVFAKTMDLNQEPVVKLINNGIEEKKGNEIYKEAHQLLKNNKNINFHGNLESRNVMHGEADVIVAGGFEGNLIGKSYEGAAEAMGIVMKQEFKRNPKRIIGALFLRKALKNVKKRFDIRESGGSLVLGVQGIALKIHGSADEYAFEKAILLSKQLVEKESIKILEKELKKS